MAPRLHCVLSTYEILRLIEEDGADVNLKDVDGATALHVARSSCVAQLLLNHGADVDARNSRGMSPLHRASNVGVARVLLAHGAPVDAADKLGNTPLHATNDMETVRLLLEYSASVTRRNANGETPIHKSSYGSKILALAKAGADIDSPDNDGRTLLMKKARCFYAFRALNPLLSLNPSVFLKDKEGKTAVEYTIDDAVKLLLLDYGVEQNWRRRRTMVFIRERPKHFVVCQDLFLMVRELPEGVFRAVVSFL